MPRLLGPGIDDPPPEPEVGYNPRVLKRLAFAGLLLAGCGGKPAVGMASTLIDEGIKPFTLAAGYAVDGDSAGHLDEKTRLFTREVRQKIRRVDGSNPDPAEIARAVDEWIASRVKVKSQTAAAPPALGKSMEYEAARTTGKLTFKVSPSTTGQTVFLDVEIEERLR